MGKAADKRSKARVERLANLAQSNMEEFSKQWQTLIESWDYEIRKRLSKDEFCTKTAVSIIERAMDELSSCGEEAYKQWAQHTYGVLSNVYLRAISKMADCQFNRLTRTASDCQKLALSSNPQVVSPKIICTYKVKNSSRKPTKSANTIANVDANTTVETKKKPLQEKLRIL